MKEKSRRTAQRHKKAEINADLKYIRLNNSVSVNQAAEHPESNNDTLLESLSPELFLNTSKQLDVDFPPLNSQISFDIAETEVYKKTKQAPCSFLSEWALKNNITHIALRELLGFLRVHDQFSELPKDSRTLLKTPKYVVKTIVSGGECIYFDLAKKISERIQVGYVESKVPLVSNFNRPSSTRVISIAVGIDGIPITRSTNKQFWPILCSVDQSKVKKPFVAALFYGECKPKDSNFIFPFVEKCRQLECDGILINGELFLFRISRILADAPARSFVKGVRNHNSYDGCERCMQVGAWHGRVVYPFQEHQDKRLDSNFSSHIDNRHIIGTSVFSVLNLGLISQVPLDYLHLVCLGVVRKVVRTWVKGKRPYKIKASDVQLISKRFLLYKKYFPRKFQRKPRSLDELNNFKGSEFRTIILYTGVVAFSKLIPPRYYKHFLLLHVAMYILLSSRGNEHFWNSMASNLLEQFVKEAELLYGVEFITYNVHGLLHIHDDCKTFGSLDNASTFQFESYMQCIKRMLRSRQMYLEQAYNRISELDEIKHNEDDFYELFLSNKPGDNCYLLKTGDIVLAKSVVGSGNQSKITQYIKFKSFSRVKSYPIDSRKLGIYTVWDLSNIINEVVQCTDVLLKYICLPCSNKFVCIPLLHSCV